MGETRSRAGPCVNGRFSSMNSKDKAVPPDVSVVIPCWNGARYLPKLAASLRPLLAPNVEVIFIDDGSTDGSAELFQGLLPEAVCVQQPNRGLGATRNRAAMLARGEFLQLLDADDTIEAGKFETQLSFARARCLDVAYSDWRMVIVEDENETPEGWVQAETRTEIVEALLGGWWYPPNAALVRRDAFVAAGGCDTTLGNTVEDFALWLKLGMAGFRFGYVPGHFANYYRYLRIRSMTRVNARELFEGEAAIILRAVRQLEAEKKDTTARRRAAARRLHSVARNVFEIDNAWYEELMKGVRTLDPQFHPAGRLPYRIAQRWFGGKVAERLATWKRRMMQLRKTTTL
jgi:glycosyltransferase involved in cell wall biosynthesis